MLEDEEDAFQEEGLLTLGADSPFQPFWLHLLRNIVHLLLFILYSMYFELARGILSNFQPCNYRYNSQVVTLYEYLMLLDVKKSFSSPCCRK